jgi:hypothetical protein
VLARFGSPLRTYTTSGRKEEGNMKPTAPKLIRWAGLSAMAAGIIFLVILPIQPPAVLSSVTTPAWAIVQSAEVAMCLLGLIGLTGLYARQANEAGWLGLAGYLLFSLFYALTLPFVFAQAFILPHLATTAPAFVESWLGIINPESPVEMNLGPLPVLYWLAGFAGYMLGGLLFGIATFRAHILPRWAAGLLAVSGPLGPVAVALLPHALERYVGVPLGLAVAWLGYALFSERREQASAPVRGSESPQLR